jgi:hypothetical protein
MSMDDTGQHIAANGRDDLTRQAVVITDGVTPLVAIMTNPQAPPMARSLAAEAILDAALGTRVEALAARLQAVEVALLAGNGRKWQRLKTK